MARRSQRRAQESNEGSAGVSDTRVLARVLALQAVCSSPAEDKVRFLVGAGFSQAETATMLHMNPVSVRTALHRLRKRGAKGTEE